MVEIAAAPGAGVAEAARRARVSVFLNFLVQGILWGTWAAQVPFAVDRLGVSTGVFGLALLSMAGGAILAMPFAGALVNRFGSRATAQVTGVLVAALFLGPTHAPTLPLFLVSGALFGLANGAWEIGLNAQGVAAERLLSRSVMSSLHGAFSVGGVAGAILGGYAIQAIGAPAQAAAASILCLVLIAVALAGFLPAATDKGLSDAHFGWPTRASVGLGLLCFLAMMSEGALVDWSALYLRGTFDLPPATAAMGYGLFSAGMAVSRLTGDTVRDRFGARDTVRVSALLMSLGMAIALLSSTATLAIAALLLVGLGIGNLVPVLFAAAGRIDPRAPARAIAATTAIGYSGFLAGPPGIGITAEAVGLGGALWIVVGAGAILFGFARLAAPADR